MSFKRMTALTLLMCLVLTLGACGGGENSQSTEGAAAGDTYKVTVVDGMGNPYTSGVIVRFMQGGSQVTMQVVDENGVAEKELEDGDYTVELQFTGGEEYYYDQNDLTLSADKKELTITLMGTVSGEAKQLAAPEGTRDAWDLQAGTTYVELTPGQRNYFLFTPTMAGTYEFSVLDSAAQIGYYGAPHFVQSESVAEVAEGKFTVSIKSSMIGTGGTGTSVIVIGVDAGEDTSCTIAIQRIGEPQYDISDEPWVVYEKTVELTPYKLTGAVADFDITASTDTYDLVLGEDGYYHLDSADGPLVLVYLGEDLDYLDCYQTILDHTGVVCYFYDENGEFVKKESYTECLLEYLEYMDEDTGVYPLTEDLKYIIQNNGDHSGWWDEESSSYLFKDDAGNKVPGINPEISWLFMCCYVTE